MNRLYFCGNFDEQISTEEKRLIPHLKRFFECAVGDSDFYAAIKENASGCGPLLESRGIFGVDPVQVAALVPKLPLIEDIPTDELQDQPQALLWLKRTRATAQYFEEWRQRREKTPSDRFNAWHQRQVNRCHSQMGKATNKGIIHATIIFELSKGCSLSCPFCGLAAEPLQEIFKYTKENSRLWQDVLDIAKERLGSTVGSGACYWATEPSDNPDYFKFLTDFGEKTGVYPQTTTAAPLRNVNWTRELLQFRRKHVTAIDRFSILSKDILRRVHATFSAEELALTNLVLQHTDSRVQFMARSGRNRKDFPQTSTVDVARDHTIACVTGYLVNMPERTVRLISPCPPSDQAPLGYLTHAEGKFSNAAELDDFIGETMERCMPRQIASEDILAFREDLEFTLLPEGFQLRTPYKLHKMEGSPHLAQLGRLIADGRLTSSGVVDELIFQKADFLAVMSSIQKLFDQGLLEDNLRNECTLFGGCE